MKLEQTRTLGQLLRDALALYREQLRTYLAIALAVVVPVDLIVLGIGLGRLSGGFDDDTTVGQLAVEAGVSFLVTTPLVTSMVIAAMRSERSSPRQAIQAGLDIFAPVLVALVLYVLALAVPIGVGLALTWLSGSGAVLLIFALGGIYVGIRLLFVIQSVVVDGQRAGAALRHSWDLTLGSFWRVLGISLVFGLATALVSNVVALPFTGVARAADAGAIALLGTIVGEVVIVPFMALVTTLLFFDLRDRAGLSATPA